MVSDRDSDELKIMHMRNVAAAKLAKGHPIVASADSSDELPCEMQVRQIEIEAPNEASRQAQVSLQESRDRYVDLYDSAPVGYLTLTDEELIAAANITVSPLLRALLTFIDATPDFANDSMRNLSKQIVVDLPSRKIPCPAAMRFFETGLRHWVTWTFSRQRATTNSSFVAL